MKRILFAVVFLLLLGSSALALTVAGVSVDPTVTLNGQSLNLNGAGLRSKFFIKVYVGALYAERKLGSAAAVLAYPGSKLIRMRFIHSKVAKEKILDAFSARKDIAHFARRVDNSAIAANSYNIAVSSYVEQQDTREAVDIKALNADIARIVARQAELRTAIDAIVADLEGEQA
jgi:hypothetical protein